MIVMFIRNVYGLDGLDYMNLIVFSGAFIGVMFSELHFIQLVSLWFITLQYCLSTIIAGCAKIISKSWRSGTALTGIMSTAAYGNQRLHHLLINHGKLAKSLSWFIILFECVFSLIFLVDLPVAYVLVVLGIAFHAMIFISMGLNNFFFAFLSSYPAILYCLQSLKLIIYDFCIMT